MKKIFRKAMTVLGSAALVGSTMGAALAASYPDAFSSNTAVVVGTGAGVAASDRIAATEISGDLTGLSAASVVTSVEGGESFMLEKSSNNFNFNDALSGVYASLDEEEMTFLADGEYDDGDVDEEYEQSVTLGNNMLSLFADSDYMDKDPTVGFQFTNGQTILSYTIDFDDVVNYTQMVDTEMPLLGKNYYVLAASSTQIDILDSAEKNTVEEGTPVTVNGKTVSIYSIDANGVRFEVDGERVDKLTTSGSYEELSDESYIVLNDYVYDTRDGRMSSAEFSIGLGKIELISGEDIEVNGEDVDGLQATITDNTGLDALTITWTSEDDTFVTQESPALMPSFESLQVVFGGLEMPSDYEEISFDSGETLTLNMENFDLPVMWWNGSDAFLGEEDYELVVAKSPADNATWTSPARPGGNLTGGLDLNEGDRFLVTNIGTDLGDVETLYYEVDNIENDSGTIEVKLDDLLGTNDITFDALEQKDRGVLTMELAGINGTTGTTPRAYINFTSSDATVYYNRVVSDKGMVIAIDTDVSDVTTSTAAVFTLIEADKDDDVTEGRQFTVDIKPTTNDNLHVSTHNLTAYDEEESDDNFIGYVPSDLASMFMFDKSADEYEYSVQYYGAEVTADVMIVADGQVSTSTSEAGLLVVEDSATEAMAGKNLIVVGGSAINSVAADLLGDAYREEAFTAETGVAAGEALIEMFDWEGNTALLVAGYNAEDTSMAVTYLRNEEADLMVGSPLKVTSVTEASAVAESA